MGLRAGLVLLLVASSAQADGVLSGGTLHHDELRAAADGGPGEVRYRLELAGNVTAALFYVEAVRVSGTVLLSVVDGSGGAPAFSGATSVAAPGWVEFPLTGTLTGSLYELVLTTSTADLTLRSLEVSLINGGTNRAQLARGAMGRDVTGLFVSATEDDVFASALCPGAKQVFGSPYIDQTWVPLDGGTREQQFAAAPESRNGDLGIYSFGASVQGALSWRARALDGSLFALQPMTGNLASVTKTGGLVAGPLSVWATGEGEWLLFSSGDGLNPCHPAARASYGGNLAYAVGAPVGADFAFAAYLDPTTRWCRDVDGDRDPSNACEWRTGYPRFNSGWMGTYPNFFDCDDTNALVHHGAAERCNGIDDDCDGLIDGQDTLSTALCEEQRGICLGAQHRPGECVAGAWLPCAPGNYGSSFGRLETMCDQVDFNCDGQVGGGQVPCPLQRGVCAGKGTSDCNASGSCTPRTYGPDYELAETRCDGLDNDCNGLVDDAVLEPCERTQGVCFTATHTADMCTATGRRACGPREYGAGFEDVEQSCDGLDNDCDGLTDFADPDFALLPCEKTLGVCASAHHESWHCGPMGLDACPEQAYGVSFQPKETRCDGLDNDCDGLVDEGCAATADAGTGLPLVSEDGCGCATTPSPALLVLAFAALAGRRRRILNAQRGQC